MPRSAAVVVVFACVLVSRAAGASEAGDLIERVREEWSKRSVVSRRLASRFVLDDETTQVRTPERNVRCGTVVAIGPRSMSFALQDALDSADEARVPSVGGVASLSSCEPSRLTRVRVIASAGRGAIELAFTAGETAAPAIAQWVPERTGTVVFLPQDPGSPPALAPLADRVASAERRAKERGATALDSKETELSPLGIAEWNVSLSPGCHRFDVLGEAPGGGNARHDLDAELREPDEGRALTRDRTDSADARLEYCVGEETPAAVFVSGSAGAKIRILHHTWKLPTHIPEQWGAGFRARVATLLHVRKLNAGIGRMTSVVRGVSGRTHASMPIRHGSCYIGIVANEGEPGRGLGLRAQVGGLDFADERGVLDHAAAVNFCAGRHKRATFEVEARGSGSAWILMLIEVVEGAWAFER